MHVFAFNLHSERSGLLALRFSHNLSSCFLHLLSESDVEGDGWLLRRLKASNCQMLHFLLHLYVHANPQTRAVQPTAGNKDNMVHP